jgi:hypothetical protein
MSDAAIVQIAQAATDKLNDPETTWGQQFTATRLYDLTAELKDDGLHVDVAIREDAGEIFNRSGTEDQVAIDVAVRKKGAVTPDAIDPLVRLLEEIKDAFVAKRLNTADAGEAWCYSWERKPAYWPGHLRNLRQFTAVLTLRFKIARDIVP